MIEPNGDTSSAGSAAGGKTDRDRVAGTLEQVRSGVRRRQAEVTTVTIETDELRLRLLELRQSEYLQEPPCVVPIPVIGPIVAFIRKAFARLFTRWYQRPMMVQQNRFNQASSRLIQDLASTQSELRQEIERLRHELPAAPADGAPSSEVEDGSDTV